MDLERRYRNIRNELMNYNILKFDNFHSTVLVWIPRRRGFDRNDVITHGNGCVV